MSTVGEERNAMLQTRRYVMCTWLLCWLLPQLVVAAPLRLYFDFPRDYAPAPAAFLVTAFIAQTQVLTQIEAPLSPPGVCHPTQEDTFCVQWPSCPPPGLTTFWVQAYWSADTISDRSDPFLTCLFTADKPCVCQDVNTPPPDPVPPPVVQRVPAVPG